MIDVEQVRKVAHLARLEITSTEAAQLTTQLAGILEYFEQLSELDVSNIAPTTRAIDVSNITRPDELHPYPHPEAILAGAPVPEGDFFKVPQIINTQDEEP